MKLPTIAAIIKKDKIDKQGTTMVIIRVTMDRKHSYKPTGIKVEAANFADGAVKPTETNTAYKNKRIKDMIAEIELAFFKIAEIRELTDSDIKSVLRGSIKAGDSVASILLQVRSKHENLIGVGTLRQWKSISDKMIAFAPDLLVSQIDDDLLIRFEQYLRINLKNANNTVHNAFSKLKSMFSKAVQLKLIDKNPLKGYKMPGYKQTKRTFLTPEDVAKIEEYADNGANAPLRKVAAWFLLCCYGSFRYSDLKIWDESKMVKGSKIIYADEKTGTPHYIPITEPLARAIKRVRGLGPVPTGECCNRFLKEIAGLLKIDVNLTMHVGRHTFAVLFLNGHLTGKNGSIEVLQRLLGHSAIKTSQIYGQITDSRIDDDFKGKVVKV